MAGQVQVGGVTVQTEGGNFGGVAKGIATGADWAIKNQELQQRKAALQAESNLRKRRQKSFRLKLNRPRLNLSR